LVGPDLVPSPFSRTLSIVRDSASGCQAFSAGSLFSAPEPEKKLRGGAMRLKEQHTAAMKLDMKSDGVDSYEGE
jgi:hypothetical protein